MKCIPGRSNFRPASSDSVSRKKSILISLLSHWDEGEGTVYELIAGLGDSAKHFLPVQWLPQYAVCAKWVDDFLREC